MKTKLLTPILALLLFGCASVNTQRVADVVREAARIGTREAIMDHPEWRVKFLDARLQLDTVAKRNEISATDLLDAIALLPVSELSSDTGRLAMDGARLLVVGTGWSSDVAVHTEQIRPVVKALADGITEGMAQVPAVAAAKSASKHYKPK